MLRLLRLYGASLGGSLMSLLPTAAVVAFFQIVVVGQPLPAHIVPMHLLIGILLLIPGLSLLVEGLKMGLFTIGEAQARAFVRKGSAFWLLAFGFALGFGSTYAEPALNSITGKAALAMADAGRIEASADAINRYHLALRLAASLAVAFALSLGIFRILKNWPVHYLTLGLYGAAIVLSCFTPAELTGLAFDSGGFTSSAITVPLVTALGIGLASTIQGRHPMSDGFGMVGVASIMPILFIMLLGVLSGGTS